MKQVEEMMKNTIMEQLGIEAVELTPERVVMKMPVTPKVHQPFGFLHGGASVVLAETAASFGSFINLPPDRKVVLGLEINANHIRSKRDGVVFAHATPVHIGSSTMVWDIRIVDEQDQLVCISRCTVAVPSERKNG